MNHTRNEMSPEDFKQIVALFAWLKMVRDKKSARVETVEPLNELNSNADEVQEDLEKNL